MASVTTGGGGDCGIHVLFGVPDSLGCLTCSDVALYRNKLSSFVKNVPLTSKTRELANKAIIALAMEPKPADENSDSLRQFPRLFKLRQQYRSHEDFEKHYLGTVWKKLFCAMRKNVALMKSLNLDISASERDLECEYNFRVSNMKQLVRFLLNEVGLAKLFDNYEQSKTSVKFPFSSRITKAVFNDYVSLLRKNGNWLLVMELEIIAIMENITIDYYYLDAKKNRLTKTGLLRNYNTHFKRIGILLHYGHYERIVQIGTKQAHGTEGAHIP